jgi:hypothetical protein
MITQEKLAIFLKYGRDVDAWTRSGTIEEKRIMRDADWYEMYSLLPDILLLKTGKASEEYANRIKQSLPERVSDEEVLQQLIAGRQRIYGHQMLVRTDNASVA